MGQKYNEKKVTAEHQQLTKPEQYRPGWSFHLVLAGVVATLGSAIPIGFNIGVVNAPAETIKSFCNESFIERYDVHLDKKWMDVLWSTVVSVFIAAGCAGSMFGAMFANKLGRKYATILLNTMLIVAAALFLFSRDVNSVEMLLIGRIVAGFAGGAACGVVPMYLTELAPPNLVPVMGGIFPMGINTGVLLSQVLGMDFVLGGNNWPYLLGVYALLIIISLPLLFVVPESPKFLYVIKKDEEKALSELSRLRGAAWSVLSQDTAALAAEADAARAAGGDAWGMLRVLTDQKTRLPLLLTCTMQAGQQFSGINAVFYYSQSIFTRAGLSSAAAQYATACSGLVNVCTAVCMLRVLPRLGRRRPLLASLLAATLALAALTASMKLIDSVPWMPYVCIAAVLVYVLAYGCGLGPIPYFIASELFEVGPRPAGMAWGSMANWGGNFVIGMTFTTLSDAIGPYCFLLFSAITGLLYLFQRMYLPETKGKSPAQVGALCSQGLGSRPLLHDLSLSDA